MAKASQAYISKAVRQLYENRFSRLERVRKAKLWQILCQEFLQQFIKKTDTVVDLGAGSCEFINHIQAAKKVAIDLNTQTKKWARAEVKVIIGSTKQLKRIFKRQKVDVFFMSNFLEHLDSKPDIFRLLTESYGIVNKGGRVLIMQPDINRVGTSYWDFFDHKVALTEKSLVEVLEAIGFRITYIRSPFLPYSTKLRFIPLSPTLLRLYLRLRPLQFVFGKQFFVCAKK